MFSDPQKNIDQFGIGTGSYVADFGAGSGFYTFAAARAVGSNGRVYAVDVQKDLLTKIKNQAQLVGVGNVDIVWADIENFGGTKLRDQSIDAVIAANIFFQLDNKEGACRELKRILKRTGRVLVVDWASSFGGMGPESSSVFDPSKAKDLFVKNGFELAKDITAGAQHYGLVFRKK